MKQDEQIIFTVSKDSNISNQEIVIQRKQQKDFENKEALVET